MTGMKEITVEEMVRLRPISQKMSHIMYQRLRQYLNTMGVFFVPRKLLGKNIQSAFKEPIKDADSNFLLIQEAFRKVCGAPFDLPSKLESPLPAIKNKLELYPWEYTYPLENESSRTITVRSPVKWVLGFSSGYGLSNMRDVLSGKGELNPDEVKRFVVNCLVIDLAIQNNPGIKQILADLRYPLNSEVSADLGKLKLTTVSSAIPSFRPPDEVIVSAVQLSGQPVFEELIDVEAVKSIEDPFKEEALAILG